jgi:superfamily II DNA/RNA helicase
MGMDVSDIDQVYNWGIPRTLPSLIQRFGRAARNQNRKGYCTILLPSFAMNMTKAEFERYQKLSKKIPAI